MYVVNFVGPPLIDKIVEQDVEEVPLNITPVACVRTGCTSCSFSSNLATSKSFPNLGDIENYNTLLYGDKLHLF